MTELADAHRTRGPHWSRPSEVDPGVPGASARRQYEKRRTAHENRVRKEHPWLGGLILALSAEPWSTKRWLVGAIGEERVGRRLNELVSAELRVLHDRKVPRRQTNIDHLVVSPAGVFVVDAKRYVGSRPSLRVEGGVRRPRMEKLRVNGRDRTKLVEDVLDQMSMVQRIVGDDVPVRGVLCFVDARWPLLGGSFKTRGVHVVWTRKLCRIVAKTGPLPTAQVAELHATLATALPPA